MRTLTEWTGVMLTAEQRTRLEQQADSEQLTKPQLIRKAIDEYLERHPPAPPVKPYQVKRKEGRERYHPAKMKPVFVQGREVYIPDKPPKL